MDSYDIVVETIDGPVKILIDPTEYDEAARVRIESYGGAELPAMWLRRYAERASGMRGGGVSLEYDSPENIIAALIKAGSDPESRITGHEIRWGFVPENEDMVAESADDVLLLPAPETLKEKIGRINAKKARQTASAGRIAKEAAGRPVVLTEVGNDRRGVLIHKSTKRPGLVQVSRWDDRGFSGDSTFATFEAAIHDAMQDGYEVPNKAAFNRVSQTSRFRAYVKANDLFHDYRNGKRGEGVIHLPDGMVTESAYVDALAQKTGLGIEEAERRWNRAKKIAEGQTDMTEDDGDEFWAYVTGVFKRSMGVLEAAALGGYNFRTDLARADDIDDISEVFRKLFGAPPSHNSPYFKDTFTSVTMKIADMVPRGAVDPERLKTAHARMRAAKAGVLDKRKPIYVFEMGNGKYKVLDGNTTLHALLELGETEAVVEVKKSLKQQVPDQNSIDAVYEQAEKAQPLFKAWAERYAERTGGKLMLRPGLKGKKRAGEKVANDYGGVSARLTDVVGGMIIFDTVEQVAAAYRMIVADPAVYKAKNRFEKPTSDGYMDVLFAANVGGHLCELQLNTEAILAAKEKGLGHKIYEVKRQIDPIAKDVEANGDLAYMAMGYSEELRKLSVKYYRKAAMSDSSSSASSIASDSETSETLDRILAKLSGSVISTHFDIDLPSIRNTLPQDRSMAKATSSFSPNQKLSESDISPPLLGSENLTRAGKKVNGKVIVGRPTRSYLSDDRMLYLQYAVVEAADLVTSHTEAMGLSDEFPQELQPRDRTRDAMVLQVERISNKLNPDRMGGSLQASTGSPIVGPDLIVESGNGRTIALRKRYSRDEAPEYRAWLAVNAAKFGLPRGEVEKLSRPVLVRVRLNKDISRMDVAEKSNAPDMGTMSPAELAVMDARRLPDVALDALRPSEDGDFLSAGNRAFMDKFVALLGAGEISGLTTKSGQATKQLADRAKAAVFQRAYGDANLLALVAEEANPDLKNVLAALTLGAKEFAKLKILPDAKELADKLTRALVAGVGLVRRSRTGAQPIEETIGQSRLFETVPEDAKHIARYIDANIRRQARMGAVFGRMAGILRQFYLDQRQKKMDGRPPEPEPTIKGALDRAAKESEPQKGLFESAGDWKEKILAAESVENIEKVFDAVGMRSVQKRENPFNKSVVRNEVYHGGKTNRTEYKPNDKGLIFFSEDRHYAEYFGGKVNSVFLNIKKPLDLTGWSPDAYISREEWASFLERNGVDTAELRLSEGEPLQLVSQHKDGDALVGEIKFAGFDGIKMNEYVEGFGSTVSYAVFSTNQVKIIGDDTSKKIPKRFDIKHWAAEDYEDGTFSVEDGKGDWVSDVEASNKKEAVEKAYKDKIKFLKQLHRDEIPAGTDIPDSLPETGILESAGRPPMKFKTKKFVLQDRYQFQGIPVSIENKAGSVRKGTDSDGHEWQTKMRFDYGYIRRTKGADDEGIDCYVGPDRQAQHVYVVKQHDIEAVKGWGGETCPECGEHVHDCACPEFFDEDKVMLGFPNKRAAVEAYLKQYDSDLFLGPVSTMTVDAFRELVTGDEEEVKIPLQFVTEAAEVRTPLTVAENIERGREAMKRVISRHVDEPRAMYRKDLGWIAFYWGRAGGPPPKCNGGHGVAKIIAKRDWEGENDPRFKGQTGAKVAMKLVDVIARSSHPKRSYGPVAGTRVDLEHGGFTAVLSLFRGWEEDVWLLSGWKNKDLASDATGEGNDSTGATHDGPTLTRSVEGADGKVFEDKIPPEDDGVNSAVLESAWIGIYHLMIGQKDG